MKRSAEFFSSVVYQEHFYLTSVTIYAYFLDSVYNFFTQVFNLNTPKTSIGPRDLFYSQAPKKQVTRAVDGSVLGKEFLGKQFLGESNLGTRFWKNDFWKNYPNPINPPLQPQKIVRTLFMHISLECPLNKLRYNLNSLYILPLVGKK